MQLDRVANKGGNKKGGKKNNNNKRFVAMRRLESQLDEVRQVVSRQIAELEARQEDVEGSVLDELDEEEDEDEEESDLDELDE